MVTVALRFSHRDGKYHSFPKGILYNLQISQSLHRQTTSDCWSSMNNGTPMVAVCVKR